MTKVKCKKCGTIGYSASEEVRCECGGLCGRLASDVLEDAEKNPKTKKAEK